MTAETQAAGFEETLRRGGHKDASFHSGGHGSPEPEHKVIVVTQGSQTFVCARHGSSETVTAVASVRAGLEVFARELQAAIEGLPA